MFLEDTDHFPSSHLLQFFIRDDAKVEELFPDAVLGELSKISVRACDLLWVLDGRVDGSS